MAATIFVTAPCSLFARVKAALMTGLNMALVAVGKGIDVAATVVDTTAEVADVDRGSLVRNKFRLTKIGTNLCFQSLNNLLHYSHQDSRIHQSMVHKRVWRRSSSLRH